jgi:hypothetical protein
MAILNIRNALDTLEHWTRIPLAIPNIRNTPDKLEHWTPIPLAIPNIRNTPDKFEHWTPIPLAIPNIRNTPDRLEHWTRIPLAIPNIRNTPQRHFSTPDIFTTDMTRHQLAPMAPPIDNQQHSLANLFSAQRNTTLARNLQWHMTSAGTTRTTNWRTTTYGTRHIQTHPMAAQWQKNTQVSRMSSKKWQPQVFQWIFNWTLRQMSAYLAIPEVALDWIVEPG